MRLIRSRYFNLSPRQVYRGRRNIHPENLRREARSAPAALGRVRVDEVEGLPHQRLFVVQRHAAQVEEALGVDKDAQRWLACGRRVEMRLAECVDAVAFARLRVEADAVA